MNTPQSTPDNDALDFIESSRQTNKHLCDTCETTKQTGKSPTSLWRGVKKGTFPPPVYLG